MRNLLNRYLSNLMTFGLEKVATGAATKCCYFILHQPKVPENLKKVFLRVRNEKTFERIVDFMEENGSIQSDYRDVYLFALQTIAVYAFNIGTGVVIGAAFGELLYCMIFLIAFMLLRQEAGGISRTGMDELLFFFHVGFWF